MAGETTKYGIVVGVDGSADSDGAVDWATREALLRDLPVTLMHVVKPVVADWPMGSVPADIAEWQQDGADHIIDAARARVDAAAPAAPPPEVTTEISYFDIVPTLVERSAQAQMMVLGSRGLGSFGRLLMGSVSTGLIHHAQCPVVVVHRDQEPAPDRKAPVLLGIDGSPASEAATAFAFDEADRLGVQLVALHAWSDVGVFPVLGMDWRKRESQGQEVLAERLAGWQERYPGVAVQRLLVCDQPARWLLQECERAQLAVVGSRGRGGFTGMLLGSVSSAVAQSANIPVVVVPTG